MRSSRRVVPAIAAASIVSVFLTGSTVTPSPTRLDAARVAAVASVPRTVTVEVSLVSAIVELPSTIGISDSNLYNLSATDLERQLTLLRDAGVTDLRVGVPWIYVQPTAQTYDWSKMDALVDTANEMGFSITASITGNTVWSGGAPLAGAPNPEAYAAFAGATAERYKGKISAYEVWNEPNGVIFYAPVSPESYTTVLQAAYAAIKAADEDAKVIGGVLGATRTVPGVTMAPEEFLARMYDAGAQGYFDALSYHPYHYTTPFSQGLDIADSPMQQVLALRALMEANGDGDLKIWATEYGTPTTPFFGLSEAQQAAFMRDFIAAWQNLDGVGPAFLYSARDVNTGAWDNEANFGLFTTNWVPKQFVSMLAEIQQQLEDGTFDTSFTADKVPFAQEMFIQVASLVLGVANTALIIPRAIGQTISGLAQQAVTALANAVRDTIRTIQGALTPPAAGAPTVEGTVDAETTGEAEVSADEAPDSTALRVSRTAPDTARTAVKAEKVTAETVVAEVALDTDAAEADVDTSTVDAPDIEVSTSIKGSTVDETKNAADGDVDTKDTKGAEETADVDDKDTRSDVDDKEPTSTNGADGTADDKDASESKDAEKADTPRRVKGSRGSTGDESSARKGIEKADTPRAKGDPRVESRSVTGARTTRTPSGSQGDSASTSRDGGSASNSDSGADE